ncbi:MAG: hypothetical protein ACRBFS_17500 [Aureispira sp.]
MSDFDLKGVWDDSDDLANAHYTGIKSSLVTMVKQQSNSIISQLKKNIQKEWIRSITFTAIFLYIVKVFIIPEMPFSSSLLIGTGILTVCAIPYFKMLRKLKEIPLSETVVYIERCIEVLEEFIASINEFRTIHLSPIFNIGLFLAVLILYGMDIWREMNIPINFPALLILVPAQYLLNFYYFDRYMNKTYTAPKEELEEMLASLKSEATTL